MENSIEVKKSTSYVFRFVRFVLVIVISLGIGFFLLSLKKPPEKKEMIKMPPGVKVVEARSSSEVMTVEAFGTVKPRTLLKITAEVPGRIDFLNPSFIEGGKIRKGDLMVRIDQRSYKLDRQAGIVSIARAKTDIENLGQEIENLKNDIVLSKSNVVLAKKEFERIKKLNKNQFASVNTRDKAEQQYLQAEIALQNIENRLSLTDSMMKQKKSALNMAQVDFEKADLAFKKTQIIAPFDGLIMSKQAEIGEYVNPGQLLASFYEKGCLDVDVSIPLEEMKWIESHFQNGQTPDAEIRIANYEKGRTMIWDAKVVRLKANIDEKTRTLPLTLEIRKKEAVENSLFDLKPGTFVKCSIMGETYENIFVIPRYLLKNNDVLFTVADSHLKIKTVNILRKFEEVVYIDRGLRDGEKIISSPLPGALEGMALTIKANGN